MIKNSELLDHLIQEATDGGQSPLTSLNLVRSALNCCCIQQDKFINDFGQEVINTSHALGDLSTAPEIAIHYLDAYSTEIDTSKKFDSVSFDGVIYNTRKAAEKAGDSVLTADKLISHIYLSHPTFLKSVLSQINNDIRTSSHLKASDVKTDDIRFEHNEKDDNEQLNIQPNYSPAALSLINQKTTDLRRELSSLIFGQDHAIQTVVDGYFNSELTVQTDANRHSPRAIFLFAGPPGVGKTYLAESTAKFLNLPFARFDMSEYADHEAQMEFIGSDKVYKSSAPGNVTSFVSEHPQSILLFDEIEKAHISIIHLFLQILDAGKLRDSYTDEEVSFTDTILIFTTNAGHPLYEDSDTGDFSNVSRKVILKALEKDINPQTGAPYFPPAICSRFATGNVVMFNDMSAHYLREIAKQEMLKQAEAFERTYDINIWIAEDVYTALLFSEGCNADARTIKSRAGMFFKDEFHELLRLIGSDSNKYNIDQLEEVHITVELPNGKNLEDKKIRELFYNNEKQNLLMFSTKTNAKKCENLSSTFNVLSTYSVKEAKDLLSNNDIQLILIDPTRGRKKTSGTNYLNIEDVPSDARDFLFFVKEHYKNIPVYILETKAYTANDEERISYQQDGVMGFINIESDNFSEELQRLSDQLHQEESMQTLAKGNLIVNYQTGQSVTQDSMLANISLFDFSTQTAVDPDESENIMSDISKPDMHFNEIIGADDAKRELQYFVKYMKNPKQYRQYGSHAPRGVILYGPPGTGKTSLAKAMACEANVTFISAQGNQFIQGGVQKVHDTFRIARKYAPSIIFVDEIDAIATDRAIQNGSNFRTDILNAFLNEMDGFVSDSSRPVFVLAATNYDVNPGSNMSLDPALMRRFDRRIYVDLPGKEERTLYLNKKIKNNAIYSISSKEIANLAERSIGMSLADLESVLDMSTRLAIIEGSKTVTDKMLDEAFETQTYGEEKKWDATNLQRTARHEAGHAYIEWKYGKTPSYITIISRGNHGGYVSSGVDEEKGTYTKKELLEIIRADLGGRAAEIVYYGEDDGLDSGASGDLAQATYLAEKIICTYGMDKDFGPAVLDTNTVHSAEMEMEIRNGVNKILSQEMENAIETIEKGKDSINKLVDVLLNKNYLNGEELAKIFSE